MRSAECRTFGGAPVFTDFLAERGLPPLRRGGVRWLQVNVTKRCNLACHHCHVESGPKRTESLSQAGAERILALLAASPEIEVLDLTGGAPELHPHFRDLVRGARALGRRVIDRCNLTVLFEPGQHDTAEFLGEQGVEIIASLPCYSAENVERQRGRGVFDGSIRALRELNALGYGRGRLRLDLVYNPVGPALPPRQQELQRKYETELQELFGISFDGLITITNMPIKRFAHDLLRAGRDAEYMSLLVNHFNPANLDGLMCRELVSIDHAGRLYDRDFNQALSLALPGPVQTIFELDDFSALVGRRIASGSHCFGCTAGAGSSCGGELS
jgi:radical SAM/Cys-rich protein